MTAIASAEHADSQADLASALSQASFYGQSVDRVEVRETHTARVFLAGDRAYKLKKPIRLPFLDYSTRERRLAMCREELRLNRRLAPRIYLGVRAVVRENDHYALAPETAAHALDHVLEMRRFDESRTLAALAGRGEAARSAGAVALRIADFHAQAPRSLRGDDVARLTRTFRQNFETLHEIAPTLGRQVRAGERFANAYLAVRAADLAARSSRGLVREGHGDLRAEHVLLGAAVEIVDCIEFDPELRDIDVGYDLAFLVMDLVALGAPEAAEGLVSAYRAADGDPGDDSLVAFFAAQRAWVRAKVALIRAGQLERTPRDTDARALAALARRFSWRARPPVRIVLCGGAATGKSHIAAAAAHASGLTVLGSDVVRKELAGLEATERGGPGLYEPETSQATYAELGRRAAAAQGSVMIDATFRRLADRQAFYDAAGHGVTVFVECVAPASVILERARRRERERARVSDATVAIARRQLSEFEPLDEVPAQRHLTLRTDRPVEHVLADIEAFLDERMAERALD